MFGAATDPETGPLGRETGPFLYDLGGVWTI